MSRPLYFTGSRQDFIAIHEMYFAWIAALYSFSKMDNLPETIDIREFRKTVQIDVGFPFSMDSLRRALQKATFELADPVSNSPTEMHYRVKIDAIGHWIRVLSSEDDTSLSRLKNSPHDTFRSEVSRARKDAGLEYDKGLERGYVWPPQDRFSDYVFQYLRSGLKFLGNDHPERRPRVNDRNVDWPKSGAIAAWAVIPISVIAIFVAIWLDKN